ncbi:MAG: SurA N-terminal domain-containing protein [Sphingomonas bacterium]|nr:SurA N-terminal domain-containing protein [Sphingomonas bacterium]
MLTFLRRLINSKVGVVVTFIVLGIIALAFAAMDVSGMQSGGSIGGNDVASVGGADVTAADVKLRANNAIEAARMRDPSLTMASFLEQNGLESILDQMTGAMALERFAGQSGMAVSKRTVDGQIASIPGLQGPTGKFDQNIYQQMLSQRRLTDAQVRTDIARDTIGQQLLVPMLGASQVPQQLVLPYASLLLEQRKGQIGFIPTRAYATGAAPTDAEIGDFYKRNVQRYTLPERRVARYALITPAMVKDKATPTDAEIAQEYKSNAARYAASETRSLTRVVVADQAGANAVAAKVKAGTSIAAAAKDAGLEASTSENVTKQELVSATSAPFADAAFTAAPGAIVGPVRTPLGFAIAKIDAVKQVPGKTLAEATPEIRDGLAKAKLQTALQSVRDSIDDALSSNGTFAEIISDQKLTAKTTPLVTAQGVDPENAETKLDETLTPIVQTVFQADEGDAPQLVQIGTDGGFAIVGVDRIVAAAPRPLSAIRDRVAADFRTDRALKGARAAAKTIADQAAGKMTLPAALTAANKQLPPPQSIDATRAQLAANPQGAPPPLALMFSMVEGSAKMIQAPGDSGWFVVKLDKIVKGDARGKDNVLKAARGDLARSVGREYAQQFANAVRKAVGVKTDPAAIARLKADLAGTGN